MRQMALRLLVSAAITIFLLSGSAGAYEWFTYNGHQYALTSGISWSDAEAEAVAAGGHLVAINSADEEAWLQRTFGTTQYFWIGFTDQETEGTWKWISGDAVTYTHWVGQEPNNNFPFGEDVAFMNFPWGTELGWADYPDGYYYYLPGIIEKPVPLPGALVLLASGLVGMAALRWRLPR